ncbi:MAG: hypothetical protein COA99_00760 [Moraxellaceae bacterium]|nr:MAG: hypothetical protein COA99_00760 [Moraxellaceae bacterium]
MTKKHLDYNGLLISAVSKLARITGKAIEKPLERFGVSLQEFRITGLLMGEKPINQKELAKMLSVKPATLSVAVNKLEEKGVLERRVSAEDKRVNYLALCEGLDFSEIEGVLITAEKKMLTGISEKDIDTTRETLKKMILNLEEQKQ